MKSPYISEFVNYREVIRSQTAQAKGIDNIPDERQLENIRRIARNVFDPVREHFNTPIYISSFFRSPQLNELIGGSSRSQHTCPVDSAAMDVDAQVFGGCTNEQIFEYIANNLTFDQLIWEFGDEDEPDWIHVSHSAEDNRGEILQAIRRNGSVIYKHPSKQILSLLK